ncbi:hypothetical protein ACSSS7_006485 [Eimeria intestinalis]
MDLKGWATAVAQRSSQLAREGMHYVEKKIEQQQQQLQQQASWGGALFRRGTSGEGPTSDVGSPPLAVPSAATYYIQASDCRGFPPSDACEGQQQQLLLLHQLTSKSLAADSSSPNCFLLPAGVSPHEVTAGLFRTLFASAQGIPNAGGALYHLRFRAPCPGSPSGFVWVDAPPEDEPVPTCSSSNSSSCCIVCKALLLPPLVYPKEATAAQAHAAAAAAATAAVAAARVEAHEPSDATGESVTSRQQQQQQQQQQHREHHHRHQHRQQLQQQQQQQQRQQQHSDAGTDTSYNCGNIGGRGFRAAERVSGDPSPDLMSGGFLEENLGAGGPYSSESLFDQGGGHLGGPLGGPSPVLPRAQSDPDQHTQLGGLHRSHTAQEPLSAGAVEPVLPRAELVANREAKKQQRMLEKLQEVETCMCLRVVSAERRAQEMKQQQDKLALPEELKLELDRWAKTADGNFKDVRTLLSTMHEQPDDACNPQETVQALNESFKAVNP